MQNFEQIWRQFEYVIDEMRSGMCFIEGYILSIREHDFDKAIYVLSDKKYFPDFSNSVWSNSTTREDWNKNYAANEYISFFKSGKIGWLHLDYLVEWSGINFSIKLIFESFEPKSFNLNIICYREAILGHHSPKDAVKIAIQEFENLRKMFGGETLFIGPDNLDYPENENEYSDYWIKI